MKGIFKKNIKLIITLCLIISLTGTFAIFRYLSKPVEKIAIGNRYGNHQYLTTSETVERQKIEMDFKQKVEEVGNDVQRQKEITDVYKNQITTFEKTILERNEKRFQKYIEILDVYFKVHQEQKKGEVFDQYIYLNSNVELKLFIQAAANITELEKLLTVSILEK